MKIDEKPLKTEYYIGYYDKERSINGTLIEKFFMTKNQSNFRIRLIDIIQNPKYIYTQCFKVCYFEKEIEYYQLYQISERKRYKEPLKKFEEWKKQNNIRNGEEYVFQPEMDLQERTVKRTEL